MVSNKRKIEDQEVLDGDAIVTKKKKKNVEIDDEQNFSMVPDIHIQEEAEAGILKKIVLTNFMCHKKLEVSLGTNVNFLIGRNGSGKSAILTAIIVGLGGKAHLTSRGNSLKNFIRDGCQACHISIVLRNQGSDAFKPHEYGDSIHVERRITLDGASSYKIKSERNQIVSTRKDELLAILDQFNIQIDNPVSILTQDTSQSFLNTSNEKKKYMFFLKATQLEQLSIDYQQILEEKEILKNILQRKKSVVSDLSREVKVYEEKYKDMEQLKGMANKVQLLKNELAWAMVRDKDRNCSEAENKMLQFKEKLPSFEQTVSDIKMKIESAESLYKTNQEEMSSFKEDVNKLLNEKAEIEDTYRKYRVDLKQANDACKNMERQIHQAEKDKACLSEEVRRIQDLVERDLESERYQREKILEEKKEGLSKAKSQMNVSNHHLQLVHNEIHQKNEEKYKLQKEISEIKHFINNKSNHLQLLETNKRDRLSLFGKMTVSILKDIKNQKFKVEPIGPLGSLIKLKDQRYAWAVEKCIGNTMTAYACDNGHDMLVLKDILKRNCKKGQRLPSIIVTRFTSTLYNTTASRPKTSSYSTIMDLLEIQNCVVANILIDQCSIESVLLIPDAKEARNLIWKKQIRNAYKAISSEGHEIIGGRSTKFYPNHRKHVLYFQSDISQLMRDTERELEGHQQKLKNLNREFNTFELQLKEDKIELDKTRKKLQREQDDVNNITMEIQEHLSYEEKKLPDVFELSRDIEDCEKTIESLNINLSTAKDSLETKLDVQKGQKQLMSHCDERCQAASEKLESLQLLCSSAETDVNRLKGHEKHYVNKHKDLSETIEELEKEHARLKSDLQKCRAQASEYCEEVTSKRKVASLESEIIRSQKQIAREEAIRGNADEITEKYQHALRRYSETKKEIESHIHFRKLIEKAIRRRSERFEKFQKYISNRARINFQMLLSQRGYTGKLKLDHDQETLTIQVNVGNAGGAATKDSKSLSGGERSFSTICFIMALWEAMEAPFRCLDEFDVFMDMLNRRISMNMLLQIAKEHQNRQFILLTPQDMSNVTSSNNVRIFKLNNPERGQETLPYQNS